MLPRFKRDNILSEIERLLAKLDECENTTAFLQMSNKLIELKLKSLLPFAFVQDEFVKKYAVDPLLKEDGPLMSRDVMSKLMFAMGKIKLETYADLGLYEQMLEFVLTQSTKLKFVDEETYDFIKNQSIATSPQGEFYIQSINQLKFTSFEAFSQERYSALIKTILKLSCESLLERLELEVHS